MNLAERAEQGRLRDKQKVERQIGRLLERHSRAASLFLYGRDRHRKEKHAFHRHQEERGTLPVGNGNRRQLHPSHELDGDAIRKPYGTPTSN